MRVLAWLWYGVVQLLSLAALVAGAIVLPIPCLMQAWVADATSIKDGRKIDRWVWPINTVFGNPEDGVSGQYALVSGQPYLPGAAPDWRAYRWSALRNSADGLKYAFAWKAGPLFIWQYSANHNIELGWKPENGYNVPVFHLW